MLVITTMQLFEVIYDRYRVNRICASVNYGRKWIIKCTYNYKTILPVSHKI